MVGVLNYNNIMYRLQTLPKHAYPSQNGQNPEFSAHLAHHSESIRPHQRRGEGMGTGITDLAVIILGQLNHGSISGYPITVCTTSLFEIWWQPVFARFGQKMILLPLFRILFPKSLAVAYLFPGRGLTYNGLDSFRTRIGWETIGP